jgi:hypothetical protein
LGKSTFQDNAKIELKRRFVALDIIRKGRLDDASLPEAFWIAYLMLEQELTTRMKNVKQLLWAGLPLFLDSFLRTRLYEGSMKNSGWPLPNVNNSLAITLSWLLSSQCESHSFPISKYFVQIFTPAAINRETPELRDEMLQLLSPFVFAAFRVRVHISLDFSIDSAGW